MCQYTNGCVFGWKMFSKKLVTKVVHPGKKLYFQVDDSSVFSIFLSSIKFLTALPL